MQTITIIIFRWGGGSANRDSRWNVSTVPPPHAHNWRI
nr:MAG TPA: hypothetical protein [Bacteriophage sp.]